MATIQRDQPKYRAWCLLLGTASWLISCDSQVKSGLERSKTILNHKVPEDTTVSSLMAEAGTHIPQSCHSAIPVQYVQNYQLLNADFQALKLELEPQTVFFLPSYTLSISVLLQSKCPTPSHCWVGKSNGTLFQAVTHLLNHSSKHPSKCYAYMYTSHMPQAAWCSEMLYVS